MLCKEKMKIEKEEKKKKLIQVLHMESSNLLHMFSASFADQLKEKVVKHHFDNQM